MAKTSKTLTYSQEDSPARTFQSQEKGQGLKGKGRVFGQSCVALLAKYNPDTHLLRTYQCSLFGEEQELLLILPKSGTIVNGRLSEQTMLVHGIEGKESGLLPTPVTFDHRKPNKKERIKLKAEGKSKYGMELRDYVTMFPTPMAKEGPGGQIMKLTDAVQISIGKKPKYYKPKEKDKMKYPTPAARDWKDTGDIKNWKSLDKYQTSLPKEVAKESEVTGQLNPTWVEWLMGFPLGWTDLKDSETQ